MLAQYFAFKDHSVCNRATKMDFLTFKPYLLKFWDSGDIHQSVDWRVSSLLDVQQQICSPCNKARLAAIFMQNAYRFIDRIWQKIFVPNFH